MSLRDSIAKLTPGDQVVVDGRCQVNYIRSLAKETGRRLKQQKNGNVWEIFCIGFYRNATGAWMKRLKLQRKSRRRWREKYYYYKCISR